MDRARKAAKKSGAYQSSHWEQPNVIAHIRLNDRTDADGNKVLFVEEIQSDWGQEGKKKGFKTVKSQLDEFFASLREQAKTFYIAESDTPEERKVAIRLGEKLSNRDSIDSIAKVLGKERELAKARQMGESGIPAAPFVSTEKFAVFKDNKEVTRTDKDGKEVKQRYDSMEAAEAAAKKVGGEARSLGMQANTEGWLNLALKRVMVMAAEGGYDKVAFINGDQSAGRYDLSQQVRKIFGRPLDDGRLQVEIELIGGRNGPIFIVNSEQELADKIGKEPAERLLQKFETSDRNEEQFISGGDLKVGGEGMKTFYDKIVPNTVKNLLPKVGGGQMKMMAVIMAPEFKGPEAPAVVSEQPGFDVTPAMKEKVETT
ncbi:MAG: hypothetical protein EBT51_09570, partial [Flavobacteriaceae bacterium]|nr:hypothetical protein [Flavobacteriaceae bacterium]